jgi:ABC-2 type transport system ATP-binding protein
VHVRRVIKEYAKEYQTTVLLSSHNMLEVEYLCDRVALIHHGRILAVGTPAELKAGLGAQNLEEVFMGITGGAPLELEA